MGKGGDGPVNTEAVNVLSSSEGLPVKKEVAVNCWPSSNQPIQAFDKQTGLH